MARFKSNLHVAVPGSIHGFGLGKVTKDGPAQTKKVLHPNSGEAETGEELISGSLSLVVCS